MLLLARMMDRWTIRRRARLAFEGGVHERARPTRWSPLQKFHPIYGFWLKQIGSKRTPEQLEQQQWILGLMVLFAIREMTGKWLIAVLFAIIAFLFPLMQVRAKVKQVSREIGREMRKLILLLRVYVHAGMSNVQSVGMAKNHMDGPLQNLLQDAEQLLTHMTFEEVMNVLARESPSEEFEIVAKALKNGAKHGTEVSDNLQQALNELNHADRLKLDKFREQQKRSGYMKFMGFFITPLVLDVGLYVWGLISGTFHAF